MPIDYSKFDSIEDSDEETAPPPFKLANTAQAAKAAKAGRPAQAGGYPQAAGYPQLAGQGGSGRESLEPRGLDQRLQIMQPEAPPRPSEMDLLASQLERMAGPSAGDAAGGAAGSGEPPKPGEPQRLCMRSDGRKKIHTTYPDGAEMVEEFDERTDVLLLRKVRKGAVLGKEAEWFFEVGQPPEAAFDPHADLLRASSSGPIFMRKDTPECFQWRIRNLPYPADVYSVTVDHEKQEVVVRTSNKKYFKRIGIPDVGRVGLKLQDAALSWKHQHNTLIISYTRPAEVAAQEQKALREAERSALKL